jgi:hypothetical protein
MNQQRTIRNRRAWRGIAAIASVAILMTSAGTALAAAPSPVAIHLNSVTAFAHSGSCEFTLNFTVTGLTGKPSALWGVEAIVPDSIAPSGGTATVATVTKADNGVAKEGVPNVSHANDGHDTGPWYVFVLDPRHNSIVALSGPVNGTSSC